MLHRSLTAAIAALVLGVMAPAAQAAPPTGPPAAPQLPPRCYASVTLPGAVCTMRWKPARTVVLKVERWGDFGISWIVRWRVYR